MSLLRPLTSHFAKTRVSSTLGKSCVGQQLRLYAESTQPSSSLSEPEFHRLADQELDHLTECFESLETKVDLDNYDVTCQMGVLTVQLGPPLGTYVINKQTPNRQIWLSSPSSGPKRYDYDKDTASWVYKHDNRKLRELLSQEFSQKLKLNVSL